MNLQKIEFSKNESSHESQLSLSEMGYKVQEDQVERLLKRLRGFLTVEMTDLRGRPLELPLKKGRDGGIDVIFKIQAPTTHGTSIVYGKVRKILIDNDY